ncbi:hypothetical protein C0J52_23381 [Blattella germanica]|nr:hypothetical protein C0J52_23381 [Blattella germanica]
MGDVSLRFLLVRVFSLEGPGSGCGATSSTGTSIRSLDIHSRSKLNIIINLGFC